MSRFVPISADRHANQGWQRFSSYDFAQPAHLVSLVGIELPKATMALPIVLVPRPAVDGNSSESRGFMFAALLGFEPGVNLFVAPDGRWLGRYVPAALRSHPFRLARIEGERLALCIDEDSGLLDAEGGEPFFDAAGEVAAPLKQVMDFLTQVEANRVTTQNVCDRLQVHGLIQPWPVKVQGAEGERTLEGLFGINEVALNALPAEALVELRDAGALSLAYCQLLSMQQLGLLGELAQARAAAAPKLNDVFSFPDDGVLHFGD
ncbi:SapC family protein [Rhabdochromatium marinum]|uniref:SapC family protein n=1 Tax=Rhabdochromatium marinum TaxID=48729 RepID=UPI001904AEAB|nr:SapC family protein [Rhabdochromatium marinum]MBK1647939.1 hypothetical protein [Rhabdochromatium marinum]